MIRLKVSGIRRYFRKEGVRALMNEPELPTVLVDCFLAKEFVMLV